MTPWVSTLLRRGLIGIALALLVSGLGSGYRAVVPPKLEIAVEGGDSPVLEIKIRSSGRGVVNITAEWLDGDDARVLAKLFVPGRRYPVFDFRSIRSEFHVPLPRGHTSAQRIRVTALPSPHWTWQPAAVVREIAGPSAARD